MGRAEDLFEKLRSGGLTAIEHLIEERQSEEFFLDFKRSANGGNGRTLHQDDVNNLSKAISGFANSEGGVIIWGVDCRADSTGADIARSKFPLTDAKGFKSKLDGKISGCTTPPHGKVENIVIPENGESGYVATLIPKYESAPLYSVQRSNYYIRAGSSFVPTPPGVLAGMFGKRTQPVPKLNFSVGGFESNPDRGIISFILKVEITHEGPGLVRDLYLGCKYEPFGANCSFRFTFPEEGPWKHSNYNEYEVSMYMHDEVKLGAYGKTRPLEIQIIVQGPIEGDLNCKFTFGYNTSPVFFEAIQVSKNKLEHIHQNILDNAQRDNFFKNLQDLFAPASIQSLYK